MKLQNLENLENPSHCTLTLTLSPLPLPPSQLPLPIELSLSGASSPAANASLLAFRVRSHCKQSLELDGPPLPTDVSQ